jgi:hypothetical protein
VAPSVLELLRRAEHRERYDRLFREAVAALRVHDHSVRVADLVSVFIDAEPFVAGSEVGERGRRGRGRRGCVLLPHQRRDQDHPRGDDGEGDKASHLKHERPRRSRRADETRASSASG